MKYYGWFFLVALLGVVACSPQPAAPLPNPTSPATATLPSATATPQPTTTTSPTQTETLPPTPAPIQVCSPLEGFTLADLPSIISNPYQAPLPGMDDGHHGVDFAFYSYPALGLDQMKGLPIHAALAGKIAAVNRDLTPYGYTVIIETSLGTLSADWLADGQLPEPAPLLTPVAPLSCPQMSVPAEWEPGQQSLYLLYAHMDQPPDVQPGQSITCGQAIGLVGTSGASVNDHLHFEVRIGPSGAYFDSLGHYDTATTEEERHNYCVWRISGWFQLVDPMLLLSLTTEPQ